MGQTLVDQFNQAKRQPLDKAKLKQVWERYLDTQFPPTAIAQLNALLQQERGHEKGFKPVEKLTIRQYLEGGVRQHLEHMAAAVDGSEEFIPNEQHRTPAYRQILNQFSSGGYDRVNELLFTASFPVEDIDKEIVSALDKMHSALHASTNLPWSQATNRENVRFCADKLDAALIEMLGFSPAR